MYMDVLKPLILTHTRANRVVLKPFYSRQNSLLDEIQRTLTTVV